MAEPSGAGSAGARREDAAGPPRWLLALYVLAALALLVPIWSVARVPTVDGPCHLYNAWVMRHLHDPAYPLFERHFRIDPAPIPNWLVQALLYLSIAVVAPATAEKLLLTLCMGLFAFAAWFYAGSRGPRGAPYAFVALPYAYNVMVHFGFYNFALSVPLALLAIGVWWRGRGAPSLGFALRLNLLLLLCYFAHIVSFAVALLAIGVLWLASRQDLPSRTWWRHPLILLPQLPLPLLFAAGHPGVVDRWRLAELWSFVRRQRALFYFQRGQHLGAALAALIVALVVTALLTETPKRRRPDEPLSSSPLPFVLAAVAAFAFYLVAPNAIGEGGWISPRLSLFPFLLVLPALPQRLSPRLREAVALACVALLLVELRVVNRRHRQIAHEVEAFLAGLEPVAPDSRVLALVWDRADNPDRTMVGHAIGYVAIEKGLLDWDDYQPWSNLFPVRAVDGVPHPYDVEGDPDEFPLLTQEGLIDYVYLWGAPERSLLRWKLRAEYERVPGPGPGELFRRSSFDPGSAEPRRP